MTVSEKYLLLSNAYDKLLDDYANLLTKYKKLDRQLHSKSDNVVSEIRSEIKKDYSSRTDGLVTTISYYCPYIRNFCLYFNSDYCKECCNEKTRY